MNKSMASYKEVFYIFILRSQYYSGCIFSNQMYFLYLLPLKLSEYNYTLSCADYLHIKKYPLT